MMLKRIPLALMAAACLLSGQAALGQSKAAETAPAAPVAFAAADLPKMFVNLNDIKWQVDPVGSGSGRVGAFLFGHFNKPGPYILVLKQPPNTKSSPHTHTDSRVVVVLQGKYYVGFGEKFDESTMHVGVTGAMFSEPALSPHYGMTDGEGAIVAFYGVGPSRMSFPNPGDGVRLVPRAP